MLIDSGSQINCLSESVLRKLPRDVILGRRNYRAQLVSAANAQIRSKNTEVSLRFEVDNAEFVEDFVVIDTLNEKQNVLLGANFLHKHSYMIDGKKGTIELDGIDHPLLTNVKHRVGECVLLVKAAEHLRRLLKELKYLAWKRRRMKALCSI